jgi:hypothetical protein
MSGDIYAQRLRIQKILEESYFLNRLIKRYPIQLYVDGDRICFQVHLYDLNGRCIEVLDIVGDCKGSVTLPTVYMNITCAWETALTDWMWKTGSARIRRQWQRGFDRC